MQPFNPLDYPTGLLLPGRVAPSYWTEHVPFAMGLVEMVRPRVLVELGAFAGVSYCAFCQAIQHLKLDTRAYAVDTWQGDPHNGWYGPDVLNDLRAYHDPLYGSFSRLVPSSFDNALDHFPPGSIDLLHVDGYHTYEAARRDFESWLPRLSPRGVVLLHDVNVHEFDFGVRRFWDEVKGRFPSFDFLHEHGLGVLGVGPKCPETLAPLFRADEQERVRIRFFYQQLGRRITAQWERQREREAERADRAEKEQHLQSLRTQLANAEQMAQVLQVQLAEKEQLVEVLRGSYCPPATLPMTAAPPGPIRRAMRLGASGMWVLRHRGVKVFVKTAVNRILRRSA